MWGRNVFLRDHTCPCRNFWDLLQYMCTRSLRNSNHILHGNQIGCEEKFYKHECCHAICLRLLILYKIDIKTANIYILETHEVAIAYKADRYKTATT